MWVLFNWTKRKIVFFLQNPLWSELHLDAIELFSQIVKYQDIGDIFCKEVSSIYFL